MIQVNNLKKKNKILNLDFLIFLDKIRFCFYGPNPLVINYNNNSNPFYNQILYSLLPNSPNYLYINPYDGCVKILPSYNLAQSSQTYIQYSVGVFNPGYAECTSVSQRTCLITIENSDVRQIKCVKKYENIGKSLNNSLLKQIESYYNLLIFRIIIDLIFNKMIK